MTTMRYKSRRKTIFSLMGALGIAATMFLYFQFFSVEMIDSHKRHSSELANLPKNLKHDDNDKSSRVRGKHKEAESWEKPANENSEDCNFGNCDNEEKHSKLGENGNLDKYKIMDLAVDKDDPVDSVLEDMLSVEVVKDLPRGAKRSLASLYRPGDNNMFTCIYSKEQIPYLEVNDDYCDCGDGTDEPGTSACINNRFYCTFQGLETHHIPSGQVDDGICDCCDGSDEWLNRTVPDHVKLDGGPYYGRYQAPCKNQCQQEIQHAKKVLKIRHQGAEIKQDYIKSAHRQNNPNMLYGPNGEFFTLSQNCYEIKSDKYEYKVCPFKEVRQQMFPEPSTLIGQMPEWISQGEGGDWVLKMVRGDSKQCPGLIKRESIIKFECGIMDKVLSVQETEVCQYTIHFTSPAAC